MIKRQYEIKGFDCPSCAIKSENHLNKHEKISSCKITYETNVLEVEYVDNELTSKELMDIIKEVEDDDISISELSNVKKIEKEAVFSKENIFIMIKIFVSLALALVGSPHKFTTSVGL